jgi:hypothetical protein
VLGHGHLALDAGLRILGRRLDSGRKVLGNSHVSPDLGIGLGLFFRFLELGDGTASGWIGIAFLDLGRRHAPRGGRVVLGRIPRGRLGQDAGFRAGGLQRLGSHHFSRQARKGILGGIHRGRSRGRTG